MDGELLAVLEHIEREKGISRDVLIRTIQAALVSAARKTLSLKPEEEVQVQIDEESGDIKVFSGGKEITSAEFGRIAAQTAKQVIIQRIREAEREVIFTEFQDKVGEIVTGTVHRFERGNIIVDLGRTEGVIPKSEQSPREAYTQGARIRAYVLEVRRSDYTGEIVLSRTHPGLLKKLFELEVPEIGDSIVEIKSVAREPGDRSKIAVYSKDEKIDCVGACVGMRGSRVKNIVRELQGEKIDIVRYSQDIKEYVTLALAPAKLSAVNVDRENNRIEVIVDDDQLSLAIGKRGQNVRLASKLIGWEIDIRAKAAVSPKPRDILDIAELEGIGPKRAEKLKEAGFKTVESIARTDLASLMEIEGIGKNTALKIIQQAKKKIGLPRQG
jgi:N utilization substance protein A